MSSQGVPQIVAPPIGPSSSSSSSNEQQIRLQILASLFPPGSANGSYIAHCKTWEDVPGAAPTSPESKKARYILLAVQADGRLKLHKSKRNTNGTFSIGKTWNVEDLRALEVHKPRRASAASNITMTCFTISINNKSYLWETENSRQQDDFLVTLVRSHRQYTNSGPLQLIGFQVGEIPGAPPAYEIPPQAGGVALATSGSANIGNLTSPPIQANRGAVRPTTASSVLSNESSYYAGPGSSYSNTGPPASVHSDQYGQPQQQRRPSNNASRSLGQPPLPPNLAANVDQGPRPVSPGAQAPSAVRRRPSAGNVGAGLQGNGNVSRPPLPNAPMETSPRTPQAATLAAPPQEARASTPTREARHNRNPSQPAVSPSSSRHNDLDETTAAAKAAALLGQQGSGNLDDSDIMLTNVEEMLEGLEWGQSNRGGGADQIEKRLLGELHALEAAGIHAIIESDDRVVDVVNHLDNALAELDKMDQMLTLYKTHLHIVSDDISHIESQNKGLQIQSSNQRALLAELDKMLGR